MRHVVVEVLAALLAYVLWLRFGVSVSFLMWFPLVMCLLAVVYIDLDHYWIPDVLVLPAMGWVCLCVLLPGPPYPLESALGVLPAAMLWAIAWVFQKVTGKEGLGFGDVKLLALLGMAMGPWQAWAVLVLSSLQGTLIGGVWIFFRSLRGEDSAAPEQPESIFEDGWIPPPKAVPMGPFLVLGAMEVLLYGEVWRRWMEEVVGVRWMY